MATVEQAPDTQSSGPSRLSEASGASGATAELDGEESRHQYFIFKLGGQTYGTPLMHVREITKELPCRPVPNTVRSFVGISNLRGQVVGVIDLKERFGLAGSRVSRQCLMIFDTDAGVIAAQVDDVTGVKTITPDKMDRQPSIVRNLPAEYVIGVTEVEGELIELVALEKVLAAAELAALSDKLSA